MPATMLGSGTNPLKMLNLPAPPQDTAILKKTEK